MITNTPSVAILHIVGRKLREQHHRKRIEFSEHLWEKSPNALGTFSLALPAVLVFAVFSSLLVPVIAQAVVCLVAGLALLRLPLRSTPSRRFDLTAVSLGLFCCLYFAPFGVIGQLLGRFLRRPGWWESLRSAGVEMARTVSPQPWVTFESIALLMATLGWLYVVWNLGNTGTIRRNLLTLLCSGFGLAGFAVALPAEFQLVLPENGIAMLQILLPLIAGGNLAGCLLAVSEKNLRTAAWLGLMATGALWGGVSIGAGWLLLAVIPIVWLWLATAYRSLHRKQFLLPLSIVLPAIIAAVVTSHDPTGSNTPLPDLDVLEDTFRMASFQPTTGVSPGNFGAVFPLYRQKADSALRPDVSGSSLFDALAEYGFPGTAVLISLVAVCFLSLIPFGRDDSTGWRASALAMLIVGTLAGLISSVPSSTAFTCFWLLLFAIALPPEKVDAPRIIPRPLMRLAGATLVLTGLAWLTAVFSGKPWHSSTVAEALRTLSTESFMEQESRIKAAKRYMPLSSRLYAELGRMELDQTGNLTAALSFLNAARELQPSDPLPLVEEGIILANTSRRDARQAWTEALRRATPSRQAEVFSLIMRRSTEKPQLANMLQQVAIENPPLTLAWLKTLPADRQRDMLNELVANDPLFEKWERTDRLQILHFWKDTERAQFLEHLDHNLITEPGLWLLQAEALMEESRTQEAVEVLVENLSVPPKPDELQAHFSAFGEEISVPEPSSSYVAQLFTLNKAIESGDPEALNIAKSLDAECRNEPFSRYWLGRLLHHSGNHRESWTVLWDLAKTQARKNGTEPPTH